MFVQQGCSGYQFCFSLFRIVSENWKVKVCCGKSVNTVPLERENPGNLASSVATVPATYLLTVKTVSHCAFRSCLKDGTTRGKYQRNRCRNTLAVFLR